MDGEKKTQLKQMQTSVRIGGKGTARRKKKVVHRMAVTDDKKLTSALKKLGASVIPGIEEVNMFKSNGQVLHFNNPKVQTSLQSNMFAISGHNESKSVVSLMPGIFSQMGGFSGPMSNRPTEEAAKQLGDELAKKVEQGADAAAAGGSDADEDDDDVPNLVGDFDEPSKDEKA